MHTKTIYLSSIQTKIWHRGRFKQVDPLKPPTDSKMLDMFLEYNGAPKCFLKTNGYWFKLARDGRLLKVSRVLYTLPMKNWLEIAKDEHFIPEII